MIYLVPCIFIFSESLSILIGNIRSHFIEKSIEGRTTRSSIEPEDKRIGRWIILRFYEPKESNDYPLIPYHIPLPIMEIMIVRCLKESRVMLEVDVEINSRKILDLVILSRLTC